MKWFYLKDPLQSSKLTFGSTRQLRSFMTSVGSSQGYLIDIPRTKGNSNLRRSLIPVLEHIQNGYDYRN